MHFSFGVAVRFPFPTEGIEPTDHLTKLVINQAFDANKDPVFQRGQRLWGLDKLTYVSSFYFYLLKEDLMVVRISPWGRIPEVLA